MEIKFTDMRKTFEIAGLGHTREQQLTAQQLVDSVRKKKQILRPRMVDIQD